MWRRQNVLFRVYTPVRFSVSKYANLFFENHPTKNVFIWRQFHSRFFLLFIVGASSIYYPREYGLRQRMFSSITYVLFYFPWNFHLCYLLNFSKVKKTQIDVNLKFVLCNFYFKRTVAEAIST